MSISKQETECPVLFQVSRRAAELYGESPELEAKLGTLGTAEDEQERATSLVSLAQTSAANRLDASGLTKEAQSIRDLDLSSATTLRDTLRDLRDAVATSDRPAIQAAYACVAHYCCGLDGVDERGNAVTEPRAHWALGAANAAECISIEDVKTWTVATAEAAVSVDVEVGELSP